jgi:hypothetical protein
VIAAGCTPAARNLLDVLTIKAGLVKLDGGCHGMIL